MSFSRYDEHGARTSHHMHRCIGARRATHYATPRYAIKASILKFSMFSVHKTTISNMFLEFSDFKIVDLMWIAILNSLQ